MTYEIKFRRKTDIHLLRLDIRNFASFSNRNSSRKLSVYFPSLIYTNPVYTTFTRMIEIRSILAFLFFYSPRICLDIFSSATTQHHHHPYTLYCHEIYFLLVQSDFVCLYYYSENNLRKDELHTRCNETFPTALS